MIRTVRLNYESSNGRIAIYIPETWDTVGESAERADVPIVLANPISGVGVLQIEIAVWTQGDPLPLTMDHLTKLLFDYAKYRGIEGPHGPTVVIGKQTVAQAHYRKDDEYVQFWVVSDQYNMALASYKCDWEQREVEARTREAIVRGIEFDNVHRSGNKPR